MDDCYLLLSKRVLKREKMKGQNTDAADQSGRTDAPRSSGLCAADV